MSPALGPVRLWWVCETLGLNCGTIPILKWLLVLFQTLEKIEDMAVSLIREEWLLDPSQKDLSREDRPENYRNVFTLGKEISGCCCCCYQLRGVFLLFVCVLCVLNCELSERYS